MWRNEGCCYGRIGSLQREMGMANGIFTIWLRLRNVHSNTVTANRFPPTTANNSTMKSSLPAFLTTVSPVQLLLKKQEWSSSWFLLLQRAGEKWVKTKLERTPGAGFLFPSEVVAGVTGIEMNNCYKPCFPINLSQTGQAGKIRGRSMKISIKKQKAELNCLSSI